MSDWDRWSVDDLLARYELEPELMDVFVEGSLDKEVLTQAFPSSVTLRVFYPIDAVDVPAACLARHCLSAGHKQRVIALARELASLSSSAAVVCLVDRDLDHWFEPLEASKYLRWTLFCSIESHFISEGILSRILVSAAQAKVNALSTLCFTLHNTLRSLYCLRLADRQLDLKMKWISLKKYLDRDGDAIIFRLEDYMKALVNKNGHHSLYPQLLSAHAAWSSRTAGDIRLASRGHDYTELLVWTIRVFNGERSLASQVVLERMFILLAESVESLRGELG